MDDSSVSLLVAEHNTVIDRVYSSYATGMDHGYKRVVLAVGIVGFVVTLLASPRPFANAWFLRRAMVWLFGAVALAAFEVGIGRWVFTSMLIDLQTLFAARQARMVAAGDDDTNIRQAIAPDALLAKRLLSKTRIVRRGGVLSDLLFHSALLTGIGYLLRSVL